MSSAAWGQEATGSSEENRLSEIIVTAQRRDEKLQDIPISVVAVSATDLGKSNIEGIRDLNIVAPSLNYQNYGGYVQLRLRGIGSSASGPGLENPVAVYVDGVYIPSTTSGALEFNNIDHIEVLNGPQGTLFGRNATGGLIQIITKNPQQELSGKVSAGYGNYNTWTGSAYLTGGLAEGVAADIALQGRYMRDGFGHNLQTGEETDRTRSWAVRSKLLIDKWDRLSILLSGDYTLENSRPIVQLYPGALPLGGVPNTTAPHDVNGAVDQFSRGRQGGVSAKIDYDFDFARLTSLSAWRKTTSLLNTTGTVVPGPENVYNVRINVPKEQFSQELQLSSLTGSSLTWTIGAYYYHEISKFDSLQLQGSYYSFLFGADPFVVHARNKTDSWAVYAQATKELFSRTNLTLGIRYTKEKRSFSYLAEGDQSAGTGIVGLPLPIGYSASLSFSKPTWRIALDHKFSDAVMGYVSYNRGFKSGGFNPASNDPAPFAPETLDSFEVGLKTELLDRMLRFNIASFYNLYKNVQVATFPQGLPVYGNDADATFYGVDIDTEFAPTRRLRFRAGASFLHAEFDKFPNGPITVPDPVIGGNPSTVGSDLAGYRLPYAPRVTLNLSGTYTLPTEIGNFDFTASWLHSSSYFGDPDNRLVQKAFDVVNLQASWSNNGFGVKVWAKNVLDKDYFVTLSATDVGDLVTYAEPRTYGVTLSKEF